MQIPQITREHQAMVLLGIFAKACPKKLLSPGDWQRFYEFSLFVHQHSLVICPRMVREYLTTEGYSLQKASWLGNQFEHLRIILKLYDEKKEYSSFVRTTH